jgi:hypothetical protein
MVPLRLFQNLEQPHDSSLTYTTPGDSGVSGFFLQNAIIPPMGTVGAPFNFLSPWVQDLPGWGPLEDHTVHNGTQPPLEIFIGGMPFFGASLNQPLTFHVRLSISGHDLGVDFPGDVHNLDTTLATLKAKDCNAFPGEIFPRVGVVTAELKTKAFHNSSYGAVMVPLMP